MTSPSAATFTPIAGSVARAAWAAASLARTLPERYSAAGTRALVSGSVNTRPASRARAVSRSRLEQRGDPVEVDVGVLVEADRQRVGRGLRAGARRARRDHPAGEDVRADQRRARPTRGVGGGGVVAGLQGVDRGGVGVGAEPAVARIHAGVAGLAGRVDPPGGAQRVAAQRAELAEVGLVAGGELAAQRAHRRGVGALGRPPGRAA